MIGDKYEKFPEHLLPFIRIEEKSKGYLNQRTTLINRMYKEMNLSPRYSEAEIEDFPDAIKRKVDPSRKIKSRFLIGNVGSGKTHMIWALFKRFSEISVIKTGMAKQCVILHVPTFLSILRSTYGKPNTPSEREILAQFTTGDYFFIDDLGAEKTTEWTIGALYLLFDSLYSQNKTIFVSSNLSIQEIADKLDDRIASRIKGMCAVTKLNGKDRR